MEEECEYECGEDPAIRFFIWGLVFYLTSDVLQRVKYER